MERSDYMKKRIISIFVLLIILINCCIPIVYGGLWDAFKEDLEEFKETYYDPLVDGTQKIIEDITGDDSVVEEQDRATENDYLRLEDCYKKLQYFLSHENANITMKQIADANNYTDKQIGTIRSYANRVKNMLELDALNKDRVLKITNFDISNMEERKQLSTSIELYSKLINALEDCTKNQGETSLSFEQKLAFNAEQILNYKEKYSVQNIALNLKGDELDALKTAWNIKLAAKNGTNKDFTKDFPNSKNIHINKNDSFYDQMNYNADEIKLYLGVYGKDVNCPSDFKKALFIEWEYVLTHGSHTDYFFQHATEKIVTHNHEEDGTYDTGYLWEEGCIEVKYEGGTYWEEGGEPQKEYESKGAGHLLPLSLDMYTSPNMISDDDFYDIPLSEDTQRHLRQQDRKEQENKGKEYQLPENTTKMAETTNIDNVVTSGDEFLKNGDQTRIEDQNLQNLSNSIYNILLIVGVIIAVLIGAIIGIKFMIGSVEEKADVKKLLVPYIVGCVVVFGAFGIWKVVVIILSSI